MGDFIASKLQVGWHQVFNHKVYTTRLCNDKEYSVRYWSKFWIQSFCHYWFIWSTTAQYPMVKQWSQSSYIIMWECVIWLMAYATENVVALALKTDCSQEMKIKSTYSKTHENSRSNTKERDKHFIINEKGYLLHSNFQQLHSFAEIERRNSLSCT